MKIPQVQSDIDLEVVNSYKYFLTESIIVCSLSFIFVIDSSNKDSNLVSLNWNSSTFA
jgi:hypothetical protein